MTEVKAIYDTRLDPPITPEERRLLDFFRNELRYGEAHVVVRDGLPVFVKYAIREVKLDG